MHNFIVFVVVLIFIALVCLAVSSVGVFGASLLFPAYVAFNATNVIGLAFVFLFGRMLFANSSK